MRLLERPKTADAAEAYEPPVDIPAEIERHEVRLKAISDARQCIEQRQHDADIERGRSAGGECKPLQDDRKPAGGRFMKRAGGSFDATYKAPTAVDDTAHVKRVR